MGKFSKNKAPAKPQKRRGGFLCGVLIYAALFLALVIVGLNYLWRFMDAYEASRPHIALDAYMEMLTPEYVADRSASLIETLDPNVQTAEEARAVIAYALGEEFSCAKKIAECTDTTQVYALRCGKQLIGTMTMESAPDPDSEFDFAPWHVVSDSFDMSYLTTGTVSVTVPEEFSVSVNGKPLFDAYITEADIPYTAISEFYGDYELPTLVSYEAGPCLGSIALTVTDAAGMPVTIDETTDYDLFLDNCSQEEKDTLKTFLDGFIARYVTFTSSANHQAYANYQNLMAYMVPSSELASRMYNAIDGLYYAQSRGDRIASITANRMVNIGNDRYLCDVTYLVDTTGREGVVQTTNNVKIILVKTSDGLKVEAMTSY